MKKIKPIKDRQTVTPLARNHRAHQGLVIRPAKTHLDRAASCAKSTIQPGASIPIRWCMCIKPRFGPERSKVGEAQVAG